MREGRPQKQAIAIALKAAGKSRNPIVEKGSDLERELISLESLFDKNDMPEVDHEMLEAYEKMLDFPETKNNPRLKDLGILMSVKMNSIISEYKLLKQEDTYKKSITILTKIIFDQAMFLSPDLNKMMTVKMIDDLFVKKLDKPVIRIVKDNFWFVHTAKDNKDYLETAQKNEVLKGVIEIFNLENRQQNISMANIVRDAYLKYVKQFFYMTQEKATEILTAVIRQFRFELPAEPIESLKKRITKDVYTNMSSKEGVGQELIAIDTLLRDEIADAEEIIKKSDHFVKSI